MCGFVRRLTDSPDVQGVLALIGLDDLVLPGGDFRPRGRLLGVIIEDDDGYRLIDPIWWYTLKRVGSKWEPNPAVTSFNAHGLHLPTWREPIQIRRAIVIADAIGESNPVPGYKTKKRQFLIQGHAGLVLGALYRVWPTEAGPLYSAAIITTDKHPRFGEYHEKSTPLFLPLDATFLAAWLSRAVTEAPRLENGVFPPWLPYDLTVTEVKTYKRGEPVAGPWHLAAD